MPVCGPPYRAWGAVDPPWKFTFFLDFNPTITPFFSVPMQVRGPPFREGGPWTPMEFLFFSLNSNPTIARFSVPVQVCGPPYRAWGGGGGPPFREGGRGPPMNFFFSLNINPTINHFLYRCRSVDPLTGHGGPWTPYVISFCFLRVLLRIQRYCHSFICNGINLIETKLKQQLKLKIVAPSIIDLILS